MQRADSRRKYSLSQHPTWTILSDVRPPPRHSLKSNSPAALFVIRVGLFSTSVFHRLVSAFLWQSSVSCCTANMTSQAKPRETVITKLNSQQLSPHLKLERRHSKSQSAFNYDNTSSNLAATTMRNELKKLVETAPPEAREVCPWPCPAADGAEIQNRNGQLF